LQHSSSHPHIPASHKSRQQTYEHEIEIMYNHGEC